MYTIATDSWKPPLVKRMFSSEDEKYFRKYLTNAFGSVHIWYVGHMHDDGRVSQVPVTTRSYEGYVEEEYGLCDR